MVDHSHLSEGNSASDSTSRDLFAEFGVSPPGSAVPSPSSQNVSIKDADMADSVPKSLSISISSDGSSENDFKAAQLTAKKDRLEATVEREKNRCLMEFIYSLGLSAKDLNSFVSKGKSPRLVDDNDLVVMNVVNPSKGKEDVVSNQGVVHVEQNPLDLLASDGALIVDSSSNSEPDTNLGLSSAVELQEVFKAAQYFTQKDRSEVVEERKKNLDLMNFISAQGFSTQQQVNEFLSSGKTIRTVNEDNVFDKIPPKNLDRSQIDTDREGLLDSQCGNTVQDHITNKGKRSWSSVVAQGEAKPKVVLDYFPPDVPDTAGNPIVIKPPRDVLLEGNKMWSSCLVGGFLNNRLPFKLVEENAHKMWDKYGLQRVFLQEKGFFVFKFSCPEDRENVLALGPWYISNKLLMLKHWRVGINFLSEACTTVPIWVKFHQIPLPYWNPKGLSFLASCIGKPIMLDKITEAMEPMAFAKICIEVTTASSFPDKVEVILFDDVDDKDIKAEVKIEYLNKPQLCPQCKTFGHSMIKCPRANYQWIPKSSKAGTSGTNTLAGETTPGPNIIASQVPSSPGPDNIGWTVVSKGSKGLECKTDNHPMVHDQNPYSYLSLDPANSDVVSSDRESTPRPNPFLGKLKMIDEVEERELKKKDRTPTDLVQKPKKKNKGGGGKNSSK